MSRVANVPLSEIHQSKVALRPVDRTTEKYAQLVESVRQHGILNPIVIRDIELEDGLPAFGLIDGLHRFTAAGDAGLTEIPAQIKNMDEADLLVAQLVTNIHKVETRPVEYSRQLVRIISQNPLMTTRDLAKLVSQSESWVNQRLGLVKLSEPVAKLVDDGEIKVTNAYALAKLPPEEQTDWIDRAMTDEPTIFAAGVNERVKAIRDAKSKGTSAGKAEFSPVAHPRKTGEIKAEYESPAIGPLLCAKDNLKTPEAGFALAVSWFLHMDAESKAAQTAKNDERVRDREAAAEKRRVEREEKKAQSAAEAQVAAVA